MNSSLPFNPNCEKCELCNSARTVCLPGKGSLKSKIMIIGEAPGREEDKGGEPFIGKSGALLDELLELAGLSRDDVYITNTVKCRPPENATPKGKHIKACPENATPKGKHIKACAEYLDAEIEAIKPKFIITLGAVALKATPLHGKITFIHGNKTTVGDVTYLPSFHPAAALRDPKRLEPLRQDFRRFGLFIRGEKKKKIEPNVRVIKNEDDFIDLAEFIRVNDVLAIDSETEGLIRFNHQINMFQIGTDKQQWILPLQIEGSPWKDNIELQSKMLDFIHLALEGKTVVAQNGKFDVLFVEYRYGVRFTVQFDVMLAAHLLNENEPVALDYLAKVYLDADDYDIPLEEKQGKLGFTKDLQRYAGLDIYYTFLLRRELLKRLLKDQALFKLFRELTMPSQEAYIRAESHGFYIYKKRLGLVRTHLIKQIAELEAKLRKLAGEEINWNAPQQVARIMFGKLGLNPVRQTAGGADSTAEDVLLALVNQHPIVPLILERRGARTLYTHFVEGWLERMQGNYLYPSYKIPGTTTGRPSSEDPNMQQVPRESKIRTLVGAPDGWEFWEADYSQIELRIAAELSGDHTMMQIFQTGGDIHKATASAASGVAEEDLTKEQRKSAKAINFGFIYGMGWRKFLSYAFEKYGVVLTDEESQNFRTVFFNKYYGLPDWHERQRRIVKHNGYVRTLTGRVRHLPEIYSPDKGVRAQAERQAINSPVQGFAAELTLMAFIQVQNELDPRIAYATGTVHDAIVGRCKKGHGQEVQDKVVKIMQDPLIMHRLKISLRVPIVAEFKLGDWGK